MKENHQLFYHIIAFIVSGIWGITFISTKTLINDGMTPTEIFTIRFVISYVGMWFLAPHPLFAKSLKDEFLMFLGGITGGSLYFLMENTALSYTLATNVSFIVCTTPLLTALILLLLDKDEHATKYLLLGSLVSLIGVALVIFNGSFVLKLSPIGDFLAFMAALVWAFYGWALKHLTCSKHVYTNSFITRKIFFYGVLTILPVYLFCPWNCPLETLTKPIIIFNLVFLSLIASLVCYALWNLVLHKQGTVKATNYIYLNPFFTLLGSVVFIHEPFTILAFLGVILIVSGMYLATKK